MDDNREQATRHAPPTALCTTNPIAWLTVFGPGAIMASLTIGTGELIFSSRGGAIFGYRVLFLFLVICLLKWTLVFSAARHMVLSGVHPLRRWMQLPFGPRGWFPSVLFLFAAICIPVWVSFHASVLGNLVANLTGLRARTGWASDSLCGLAILTVVFILAVCGGYRVLERVQLAVVVLMLLAVTLALVLFQPDWSGMLAGFLIPQKLEFPRWLIDDLRPAYRRIAEQPVWVEATIYVGVIGGSSYDYLAYVSFMRDKNWGRAKNTQQGSESDDDASFGDDELRTWIRAPLIDCSLSFLVVLFFSAVFVASGARFLAPAHQIPGDGSFLEHQAQFVTRLHPWLYPLYILGAFLTMVGTLYGTLEVGPTVLREIVGAWGRPSRDASPASLRLLALFWCAGGAILLLVAGLLLGRLGLTKTPIQPTQLLIPANLFTGILSCGLICLLNPWMDRKFLAAPMRMPILLVMLNLVAAVVFLLLGIKGYLDQGGWPALGMLAGTVLVGWLLAGAFAWRDRGDARTQE